MTLPKFLDALTVNDIKLELKLVIDAPPGVITDELRHAFIKYKPHLLAKLGKEALLAALAQEQWGPHREPLPDGQPDTYDRDERAAIVAECGWPTLAQFDLEPVDPGKIPEFWTLPGPDDLERVREANRPYAANPANSSKNPKARKKGTSKTSKNPSMPLLEILGEPSKHVSEESGKLTHAMRWLAAVVQSDPKPRSSFYEIGDTLGWDSSTLDQAADRLGVIRTIEKEVELWSIP